VSRQPGARNTSRWIGFFLLGFVVCLAAAYDRPLMLALSQAPQPAGWVADVGYYLGLGYVQIPLLLGLTVIGRIRASARLQSAGLEAAAAFVAAGVMTQILKHLIGRPRPRLVSEVAVHFGPTLASGLDSFPSGHTATVVAAALVLGARYPQASPVFMFVAAFVSASRLFSGSHYPTDILGGVLLGLGAALVLDRLWLARSRNTGR